ncbi:MAG: NAD(P)/FAD-dependent oxidoreductase [Lachnospiraceae bacterium]|nr:NAD(P)/FAD-dependent oxidoreductase [Lachnospiraceae bacterium]
MRICVVGGGVSGLAAAIAASEKGNRVTVIEHGPRVGKKLLSTGNGKCNLSNTDQDLSHYHGDREFIRGIFERVSYEDVISFLTGIGIFTKNRNGYLYPYSEQASAVLDVLRFAARKNNVEFVLGGHVKEIITSGDGPESGFIVNTENSESRDNDIRGKGSADDPLRSAKNGQIPERYFDRVIIAAGSKAAPSTGSDGSGYLLAEALGHRIVKPLPALVPLRSDAAYCKELKGVRFNAKASVCIDGRFALSEEGEIQFTDYGLSGIPVFQLSGPVARALDQGARVRTELDLIPFMSEKELFSYLSFRKEADDTKQAAEFLIGLLPKSLALLVNRLCNIKNSMPVSQLSDSDTEALAGKIKGLGFNITGTQGFDKAQVCSGGVDTAEISETLESKLLKGLYFAGEIIDVYGDCGGYNLTWAFATGLLAGRAQGEEIPGRRCR